MLNDLMQNKKFSQLSQEIEDAKNAVEINAHRTKEIKQNTREAVAKKFEKIMSLMSDYSTFLSKLSEISTNADLSVKMHTNRSDFTDSYITVFPAGAQGAIFQTEYAITHDRINVRQGDNYNYLCATHPGQEEELTNLIVGFDEQYVEDAFVSQVERKIEEIKRISDQELKDAQDDYDRVDDDDDGERV